ncbi:NADH dehydrogenase FAD-containing subunit [Nocardia tenerifensis]|uniref:NADH dehydrogenase FAD-containing subunit n=1 Tax=Nocardia tenerifensis TaxID=228006 RepID=A0A318K239_9NOCA|nr:FAD-dependent oxidoreductase [Nocardia tenerifensis]PXX54774.1 NADH dehydrogenase FAD-containing subunit [Nocardia tenerifensis]
MTDSNSITKVVVIGGGYAGAVAVNRLRQRRDVEITLVNPRAEFIERMRLHQFVADAHEAAIGYDTLLGAGVRLIVDSAVRLDTADRRIELASGRELEYDYVVYAVGSTAAVPASVPGAVEFAYPIAEFEHAQRLRAALREVPAAAPIVVVGGGLTGVETAAELAEQGRAVTLVDSGKLAANFADPARRSVRKWLTENGVDVREETRVREVRCDGVVVAGGEVLPSALTIWTAGFGVPELAARSGLRTDELGRLLTDETLTSIDDDRIVAAGDAVAPSGRPLRMSCYAAQPLGAQAADTVLARIAGSEPAVLDVAFVACTVGLGRRAGAMQFSRRDDTPVPMYIGGRVGGWIKERVGLAGPIGTIRKEARKPGAIPSFMGLGRRKGLRDAETAAAARP